MDELPMPSDVKREPGRNQARGDRISRSSNAFGQN
jgi:hypothetical protein